ncbi:MAG: VOC family protein [Alphaproteobacteria bacterium]
MPIPLIRLHHVNITMPPEREAECLAFYGDILGLERIPKPPPLDARGGGWFKLGNVDLHVSRETGADGSLSKRHICLQVEDLAAARAHLEAAGVSLEPEETEPYGMVRFFLRDPAGNKLEIAQAAA